MSIPPNSPWRGAAAFTPQPVKDEHAVEYVAETIYDFNCRRSISKNLPDIEYRSSDGERDITRHVFRWDKAPYDFVFQFGFEARRQKKTPDETYYNLELYVNSGGRPLDTRKETTHAFVSTTISSNWHPTINPGTVERVYRYEMYAPGGIWVHETLGKLYRYASQEEAAFPAGIAPQYIRSAQLFELSNDRQYTQRRRVDNILYINSNFNPQSHPQREIKIHWPISVYKDGNKQKSLQKRPVPKVNEYYTEGVTNLDNYIDSAFRSTRKNEVYIFIKGEYVLLNYAPGTTNDRIISGPDFIGSSFNSLVDTVFAEYGIDAAFGCHDKNEAVIFSGKICARINYAAGWTSNDQIIEGPKTIKQMFPFFKGTNFENGVDAAFESTKKGEAYLFKGSEYALVDYHKPELIHRSPIADGFKCLRHTLFERDIGAAFASHVANEVYLFKGNGYMRLHVTPGGTKDYAIDGPREIVPTNWPSLKEVLPRKNIGLDGYDSPRPATPRDQDEF